MKRIEAEEREQRTEDPSSLFELRRGTQILEVGSRNSEVGILKLEAGPVVIRKGLDYAVASMRPSTSSGEPKWEKEKMW